MWNVRSCCTWLSNKCSTIKGKFIKPCNLIQLLILLHRRYAPSVFAGYKELLAKICNSAITKVYPFRRYNSAFLITSFRASRPECVRTSFASLKQSNSSFFGHLTNKHLSFPSRRASSLAKA